ncbi:chromosome partition protein Smc-like [Panicum virgatum]|uniref:chromosome partition protein Smc-like n=1 Tax=Panicum virgatum TaxID=38727 RepID=UPI0019D5CD36|nr:chromosome partition protein Smc-like [Panicum virgatum]
MTTNNAGWTRGWFYLRNFSNKLPAFTNKGVSRRCHPSRPPIPEKHEVNCLHAEVVKKRKEAAEAAAERKRKRKAKHDRACKITSAEGKPRPAMPESTDEEEDASDAEANFPANLSFPSPISSSGAVANDAAPLAPTKAHKTGARATSHSAPQPPPVVDIVAEAAKLREAMVRGAQAAQQDRAPGNGGDAGQSGAEADASADAVGEASRGGADGTARPVVEEGAGGDTQEHLASQTEAETLVLEPPRARVKGVTEESAQTVTAQAATDSVIPVRLRDISRKKSAEMTRLCSQVHWLGQHNTGLVLQSVDANMKMTDLEARRQALEELARTAGERDVQRDAAEQKAQKAEAQTAELQLTRTALEQREAELQRKETELQEGVVGYVVPSDADADAASAIMDDADAAAEEFATALAVKLEADIPPIAEFDVVADAERGDDNR